MENAAVFQLWGNFLNKRRNRDTKWHYVVENSKDDLACGDLWNISLPPSSSMASMALALPLIANSLFSSLYCLTIFIPPCSSSVHRIFTLLIVETIRERKSSFLISQLRAGHGQALCPPLPDKSTGWDKTTTTVQTKTAWNATPVIQTLFLCKNPHVCSSFFSPPLSPLFAPHLNTTWWFQFSTRKCIAFRDDLTNPKSDWLKKKISTRKISRFNIGHNIWKFKKRIRTRWHKVRRSFIIPILPTLV